MNTASNIPTSFVVVLLDDLWISDELVDKGTAVPVDRALRNDWVGSKMARDATDEELEQFRAEELEAAAEAAAEAEKAAKKNTAK
ncbi:hypothetical protein [Pseudomonas sp. yb_9]|uniref:hypothetical protein n=1 Tax=Pseudomonas sp. yb_9 TaxID=3367222 RepID=UPI00370B729C